MDTGWLLVGVAGITGGLALVLVGAGVATTPLLLPVGLCFGLVAYLAWAAGSSRVVSTVYEEVGDPGREAAADSRTGRPEDRADPDGNWRGTAADGGTDAATGGSASDCFDGPGGPDTSPGPGTRTGLGPDGERIWDARERDRVGGWDDWDADWEWADRHWRSFQREYGDADWTESEGRRRSGASSTGDEQGQRRGADRRGRTRQRSRTGGQRGEERHRDRGRRSRRTGPSQRRRARRERRGDQRARRARELLDVPADADAETIRRAYRDRVKEVHPDRGGDPELFKRVQWAYEYLSEE
ncbi:J domain-containing protein [Haloglomus litoreum]|uniref:J domain-containing protein n=1 Tax=Haloglomus litoreum TaxID=3034026 RepID=UPI0023E823F3|nr:J domain-containing protein [Haloglomus sp. DT116]